MIDTPEVVETTAQITAVVRLTVPRSEIQTVMGPAIGEVFATLGAQGLAPAGAVFSYHHRVDPEVFDFEVGVPIAGPLEPVGRVVESHLPATTVARTTYHGPYEGLGDAWGEFKQWVAASGHKAAAGLWEVYATGPESSPNPADWRTVLHQPLAKP